MNAASRVAVGIALAGVVLAGSTVQAAQAAPTGCKAGGGGTYITATCSGGTGWYQAYGVCASYAIPGATFYWFVESGWVKAKSGKTAWVWCGAGTVTSRGVGIKK